MRKMGHIMQCIPTARRTLPVSFSGRRVHQARPRSVTRVPFQAARAKPASLAEIALVATALGSSRYDGSATTIFLPGQCGSSNA